MKSLAEYFGVLPDAAPADGNEQRAASAESFANLSGKAFSEAVVNSLEFRRYILNGLTLGDLPPAVICRLIDHAWGKPVDRLEVKDTTDTLEGMTAEQLEQRALFLAEVARRLRFGSALDSPDDVTEPGSVH